MPAGIKANSDGSAAIQVGGTDVITLTSGGAATFVTSPTTVQAGTAAAPSITFSGDTNTGIYSPGADTIAFTEGGAEVARFDSSGNLLVGRTNTTITNNTGTVIAPTSTSIAGSSNNGTLFLRNCSATVAADIGGLLRFDAVYRNSDSDVTDIAGIAGLRENATSNNYAGYLAFSTTPNGGSRTERARITSGGNFLVGTNDTAQNTGVGIKLLINESGNNQDVVVTNQNSTSASACFTAYSTAASAYRFYVTMDGKINCTSTTIAAISDIRFKENIQDLDVGLDAVMALKPRKFDWKEGKGKDIKGDRGWIAQEFEQVFPDMISTWRDEPPEGEEPYKAVGADLIPVLVKAIQEQQAMIDELKAKVAALEGA